jgi:hypothetical protein
VLKEDIENLFFKFNFFRAACKSLIEMRSYFMTVITVTFYDVEKHVRPFGGRLSLSAQKEGGRIMNRDIGK